MDERRRGGAHVGRQRGEERPTQAGARPAGQQASWGAAGGAGAHLDGPLRHDDVVVLRVSQRVLFLHRHHLRHPVSVLQGPQREAGARDGVQREHEGPWKETAAKTRKGR